MVEAANTVSVRDDILGALGLASDKISLNRLAQGSEAAFLVAPQVVAAVA
jgi:hypothetical protein